MGLFQCPHYLEGVDIFPIFAATIIKNYNMSIDTYKLTSMEEPYRRGSVATDA